METIHVVLTSSNEYVAYAAVTMTSVLRHVSADYKIKFHLFSFNIQPQNQEVLRALPGCPDYEIEFLLLDPSMRLPTPKQKNVHNIAYTRLLAGSLLPDVDRCIVMDCDLVFDHDIARLWNTDLGEKVVAMAKDPLLRGDKYDLLLRTSATFKGKLWWENFDVPHEYFYTNSGVLLIDLKKWRESGFEKKIFENLEKCPYLTFYDQDVLFITCCRDTFYLDSRWNFLPMCYYSDPKLKEELAGHSFVYHFGSPRKPWLGIECLNGEKWWENARLTPFYEVILSRMLNPLKSSQPFTAMMGLVAGYSVNLRKYYKYRFLSNFVFGKTKKRYLFKKQKYKARVQEVRDMRDSFCK